MVNPKFKIGVSGAMMGNDENVLKKAYQIGSEIAKNNCVLFYGACNGYPREAVRGDIDNQGTVIGISPALNRAEHNGQFGFDPYPEENIVYSGLGKHARDVVFIRSVDAAIYIGGGEGTLLEFCIAWGNSKIIGVLEQTGGISDHLREISAWFYEKPGLNPILLTDSDPNALLSKILKQLNSP